MTTYPPIELLKNGKSYEVIYLDPDGHELNIRVSADGELAAIAQAWQWIINSDEYSSESYHLDRVTVANEINDPHFLLKSPYIKRTVSHIFMHQGFYAALSFCIKAGLLPGSDQETAEAMLKEYLDG